ncbi:MAG: sigma-70 family RNA polymerase sigma factor [Candidatus Cloacimonetes bacterium]|nr:sigma-70 family RNA polymerase sigma factor [Candidatus Cloacimonadota bacterium]
MKNEVMEALLRQHGKKIYNYLLKMLRHSEDAEDILQSVFLAFYQKADSVNEESYLPYLYRTAYNRAINYSKKRQKLVQQPEDFEIPAPEEESREEAIRRLGKNKAIATALQTLNEREKLVIELQYYQKMSYSQIARILDTTESAVDSLLVRAKRKLKKKISQDLSSNSVQKSTRSKQ